MEVSECCKMVEFPKISIKMKNCKTFYEGQTASRVKEIILPHQHPSSQSDKILLRLWNKNFLTEICKNVQTFAFKNAVLGRQEMMQCKCFFLTPNRKMLVGKFAK